MKVVKNVEKEDIIHINNVTPGYRIFAVYRSEIYKLKRNHSYAWTNILSTADNDCAEHFSSIHHAIDYMHQLFADVHAFYSNTDEARVFLINTLREIQNDIEEWESYK